MTIRRSISTTLVLALATVLCLALAVRARAVVLPATTIDGPSQEIVGFGGVAMAEDGTGGLVYLKRVEGVPHVFVSQLSGRPLAAAGAGRRRRAVRGELASHRRRQRRRADRRVGHAYATEHEEPVDELMGAELGPAASHFGQAIQIDPNIQDATGTSPDLAVSSTGQADVVYRVVNRGISGEIPLLHPGDVVEQVRVAHFDGSAGRALGAVNRQPGVVDAPAHRSQRPEDRDRPDRQRRGRLAGAGNRQRRRAHLGAATVRQPARLRDARQRLRSSTAAKSCRTPTPRASRSPRSARPSSPTVRAIGPGFAAARAAHLPQHAPGRGIEERRGVPRREPRRHRSGRRRGRGRRPAEHRHRRTRETRLAVRRRTARRASSAATTRESSTKSCRWDRASWDPKSAAVSVMNPEGGGVSAWPSADADGRPAVAVREDFPSGAVQTGLSAAAAAVKSPNCRSGARASAMG